MREKQLVNLIVRSLESVAEPYRQPYQDFLYERILCYEFYHQFRMQMKDTDPFVLHGELEKGYRGVEEVPDFVFHVPSTDEKNLMVIEFKSTKYSMDIITDTLKKLCNFKGEPFKYQTSVFVLFGPKKQLADKYKKLRKPEENCAVELFAIAYDTQSGKTLRIKSL